MLLKVLDEIEITSTMFMVYILITVHINLNFFPPLKYV